MSAPENLNDSMASFAADAVAHARINYGAALDGGDESMRLVEQILGKYASDNSRGILQRLIKGGAKPAEMDKQSKMYGAYLGEILRKKFGGGWEYDEQSAPGYRLISLKLPGGARIFPPLRVHERLTQGEAHNVWTYFQSLLKELSKDGA